MKAYVVSVTFEAVVLASSPSEARKFDKKILEWETEHATDVEEMGDVIPDGWEMDSNVYHSGDGDITVADAIRQHKEQKKKDEFDDRQVSMFERD